MSLRLFRLVFALLVVLLLAPWPVAFAQSGVAGRPMPIQIGVAGPPAAPDWPAFGGAIGGVDTPGDLFYIDATNNAADLLVTLYLTNTRELGHGYRYLTLKIGLYAWSDEGEWQKTASWAGEPIPDTYLTLRNGQVNFLLAGYTKYKVTIDDGSFYTTHAGGGFSPQFYLTVDPA